MNMIGKLAAFELRSSLLNLAASVKREFTPAGAALVNKLAQELHALTGEVFDGEKFIPAPQTKASYMHGHFSWMRQCRWTVKEIRYSFRVPSAIARHIQDAATTLSDAEAIAAAHEMLTNGQIGF